MASKRAAVSTTYRNLLADARRIDDQANAGTTDEARLEVLPAEVMGEAEVQDSAMADVATTVAMTTGTAETTGTNNEMDIKPMGKKHLTEAEVKSLDA